ncbi:rhodanese-like domain-containing protein [Thermobifida halotolerans]|uniref:Rhodanese-like domain-containing protein n=1 Tax=Thermobifida halotolerans TaxID=483545 RepID=A0A399FYE8_9ACTN|nr:rhodanese-like domain-containing protein [Thermobifida halotolerans]UOE18949.1 rhodanese-like domain-containing protein [Thermobifida halotolerans]
MDRLDAARAEVALVLDVREPGEFASGHVPGAANLPLERVAAEAHRFAGRPVCVICRSGQRSLHSAPLNRAGAQAVSVAGGTRDRLASGRAVTTG